MYDRDTAGLRLKPADTRCGAITGPRRPAHWPLRKDAIVDINWYGLSCFRLRERGVTAICDPFGSRQARADAGGADGISRQAAGIVLPKLRADIVTISHDAPAHVRNASKVIGGEPKILRGPGDYEVKQVLVTGLPTSLNGTRNVAFFLDFAGLTVGHLGELGQVPAQRQVEELGDIDVLLAPVSGPHTPDVSRIAEVISLLDPRIVVPMHYPPESLHRKLADTRSSGEAGAHRGDSAPPEPVERFLTELGVSDPEVTDTLKLTKHSLPEETQVVLLRPKGTARSPGG